MDNTVYLKLIPGQMPQLDQIHVESIPGNSMQHPVVILGNDNVIEILEGTMFTVDPGVVVHFKNLTIVPEN